MDRKRSLLSALFAAGFVFVSVQAMEPTQPMDLDLLESGEIYQPPAVETQPVQPAAQQGMPGQVLQPGLPAGPEEVAFQQLTIQPFMIDGIACSWMQRPNYLHNLVHNLFTEYGKEVGAAVVRIIYQIIRDTSIILVNNSDRAATVTIGIQINDVQPIQVGINPHECIVLPLPENLQIGLRQGIHVNIRASVAVTPPNAPLSFGKKAPVTGGARIIITTTGMSIGNMIRPTLPLLVRQNARRKLF